MFPFTTFHRGCQLWCGFNLLLPWVIQKHHRSDICRSNVPWMSLHRPNAQLPPAVICTHLQPLLLVHYCESAKSCKCSHQDNPFKGLESIRWLSGSTASGIFKISLRMKWSWLSRSISGIKSYLSPWSSFLPSIALPWQQQRLIARVESVICLARSFLISEWRTICTLAVTC